MNKRCCGTNEPNNNLMCINKNWQKLEYKTVCEYGMDAMTQESCPNKLNDCPDWFLNGIKNGNPCNLNDGMTCGSTPMKCGMEIKFLLIGVCTGNKWRVDVKECENWENLGWQIK